MRKLFILVAVLSLSLMITKAQDKPDQAPIIVQYEKQLIAVSAEDGTSHVLLELPKEQVFASTNSLLLSPDSTKLVYTTAIYSFLVSSDTETDIDTLFILDLADGSSTELKATGGSFGRNPANHYFDAYPTWSVDGTRLYYSQIEIDPANKSVDGQIVYYDMAAQQYHLVARYDPSHSMPWLTAIQSGVMAYWPNGQTWDLYTPDNHVVDVKVLKDLYGLILHYKGQAYYALTDAMGRYSTVINIETGKREFLGGGYYIAERSLSAGDQSLITLHPSKDVTLYRMLASNKTQKVTVIPGGADGIMTALSPDGQSMAYLQFDDYHNALLRIMNPQGYTDEYPILGDAVAWGASETIVFHKPVGK